MRVSSRRPLSLSLSLRTCTHRRQCQPHGIAQRGPSMARALPRTSVNPFSRLDTRRTAQTSQATTPTPPSTPTPREDHVARSTVAPRPAARPRDTTPPLRRFHIASRGRPPSSASRSAWRASVPSGRTCRHERGTTSPSCVPKPFLSLNRRSPDLDLAPSRSCNGFHTTTSRISSATSLRHSPYAVPPPPRRQRTHRADLARLDASSSRACSSRKACRTRPRSSTPTQSTVSSAPASPPCSTRSSARAGSCRSGPRRPCRSSRASSSPR